MRYSEPNSSNMVCYINNIVDSSNVLSSVLLADEITEYVQNDSFNCTINSLIQNSPQKHCKCGFTTINLCLTVIKLSWLCCLVIIFSLIKMKLRKVSTLNVGILGKINLFAYYGRDFITYSLKKKICPCVKNCARGMHFYVKVYRMTRQNWADSILTQLRLEWCNLDKVELFLNFHEISGGNTGFRSNNGWM